jgi:hypothetical protein
MLAALPSVNDPVPLILCIPLLRLLEEDIPLSLEEFNPIISLFTFPKFTISFPVPPPPLRLLLLID